MEIGFVQLYPQQEIYKTSKICYSDDEKGICYDISISYIRLSFTSSERLSSISSVNLFSINSPHLLIYGEFI